MNYTEISFYDFDGCLMNSPLPDEGKMIWQEKTGQPYPYEGWWGRAESLNSNVFDIKPFPNVLNHLKKDQAKAYVYTVLLTSRMTKLKPQIEQILSENNIMFDELSLKSGGENKTDRILKFLEKFPTVHTINIYDDRDKELVLFEEFNKEFKHKYIINIYRVTEGKITPLTTSPIERIVSEEISIYMERMKK